MKTETQIKMDVLAEEYARLLKQAKITDAKIKEIKETLLTGLKPGELHLGSDFELRCFEGKTTVSWSKDDPAKVQEIQERLLTAGVLQSNTGLPYLRIFDKKGE